MSLHAKNCKPQSKRLQLWYPVSLGFRFPVGICQYFHKHKLRYALFLMQKQTRSFGTSLIKCIEISSSVAIPATGEHEFIKLHRPVSQIGASSTLHNFSVSPGDHAQHTISIRPEPVLFPPKGQDSTAGFCPTKGAIFVLFPPKGQDTPSTSAARPIPLSSSNVILFGAENLRGFSAPILASYCRVHTSKCTANGSMIF